MIDYADRIKPTDYSIGTFLDTLLNKKYQIPTFQREVVWERDFGQEIMGQRLPFLTRLEAFSSGKLG